MTDEMKLPEGEVRRFVPKDYVSQHRGFWASGVRIYPDDVEVIVYPADGIIVDDFRNEIEEASRYANERLKAENKRLRRALEQWSKTIGCHESGDAIYVARSEMLGMGLRLSSDGCCVAHLHQDAWKDARDVATMIQALHAITRRALDGEEADDV